MVEPRRGVGTMRSVDRVRSAAMTGSGMEKRSYLANTAWKVSIIPFKHCIVRDVFVAPVPASGRAPKERLAPRQSS